MVLLLVIRFLLSASKSVQSVAPAHEPRERRLLDTHQAPSGWLWIARCDACRHVAGWPAAPARRRFAARGRRASRGELCGPEVQEYGIHRPAGRKWVVFLAVQLLRHRWMGYAIPKRADGPPNGKCRL
jgi:hypothetical protein